MTLLISNEDAGRLLTIPAVIAALEGSYRGLASGEAVCRPRIDVELPSGDPERLYRWGTMEGGGPDYFAIRMKSDIVHWQEENGVATREKYCVRPGLFCGLIFLFSTQTGEPLALLNDGVIQHMRVGADSAIGVKYMAREDCQIVGMLGSGGMARSHIEAFLAVRPGIRRLQVYSPTTSNREKFAAEIAERYGIEAVACDAPEAIYEGADIVAAVTDAARPVLDGDRLEKGCHVVNIGAGGAPDPRTIERCDVYLRFGDAPAPRGRPGLLLEDEYLSFTADAAMPVLENRPKGVREDPHGVLAPEKLVSLAEVFDDPDRGRKTADQITYSERGNLQGAQFWAVASIVYEAAKEQNLGRELPTEWFVQDIRN
jgi:ornithine cyclodeaminase/alanine dehydrogenase-like protein (mu-crystallin family)